MPGGRTVAAGTFALQLDGKDAGPLRSFSGGDAYADVVVEAPAGSFYAKKHVANVKWTPLKLSVGAGMGKQLAEWIAGTLAGSVVRKDGAVVERDATGTARAKRAFTNALISEVTFPALDGASKEAAVFGVEITPEQVSDAKASGKAGAAVKQKAWQVSSFRVEIGGLPCEREERDDHVPGAEPEGRARPRAALRPRHLQAAARAGAGDRGQADGRRALLRPHGARDPVSPRRYAM
jgi:hypothetical protein